MVERKRTSTTRIRKPVQTEQVEPEVVEPKKEPKQSSRGPVAEFVLSPLEQQWTANLQAHLLNQHGERRQRAAIWRSSCHHGLLVEMILAGPDSNGLYAGRYSGKELAEMTRQQALLLSDVQSRYSTPILQAAPLWPATLPAPLTVAAEKSNGVSEGGGDTKIDAQGATALKGLGAGLMKSSKPRLPPPE